ncbi:MAG: hypothetical protein EP307_13860 [Rhodobacteraceae bacterium]|nr:MAG: hypothetical protein EP307_13860 [Paracoccaceae bacterium]
MRIAFLTMVWRDYWLLEKWIAHNSRLVGRRGLYVLNHGGDPEVDRIAEGCNVLHVPRDEVTIDLTRLRWNLLGGITSGLLSFYDRVICTDVDELLVYVGDKPDLVAHLAQAPGDEAAISPVGLNLIPTPGDGADSAACVLQNHPHALLSARYTKPCIVCRPVEYTVGGHGLIGGTFRIDPEIVLVHLHYVTPDYAQRMAARQEIVAQSRAHNAAQEETQEMPARFWANWARPSKIRNKELAIHARARDLDVRDGFGAAADLLRAAVTHRGRRSLVEPDRLNDDPVRITLPDRWRSAL